jgi:hypothetical protein
MRSTIPCHVGSSSLREHGSRCRDGSYIVFQDISRDQGLVDARVPVGFKVDKRLLRDALMNGSAFATDQSLCIHNGGKTSTRSKPLFHPITYFSEPFSPASDEGGATAWGISVEWVKWDSELRNCNGSQYMNGHASILPRDISRSRNLVTLFS